MTTPELPLLDYSALLELAAHTCGISIACACSRPVPRAWTSMPLSLPNTLLDEVATLRGSSAEELTFEEFHPAGTNFWSEDAPIAMGFYPYNDCTVWSCRRCGRSFLFYVEGGGYFVDRRIRLLSLDLVRAAET